MSDREESPSDQYVLSLAASLEAGFAGLEGWLACPEQVWSARPSPGTWSVGEVVEHVVLMQRYVLLLVDKIGERALRRLAAGATPPAAPADPLRLEALAERSSAWSHPEHMTPGGRVPRAELARELALQRARCLGWLRRLPHGEGRLHSLRMSVVDARLDLYQYLRLVDLHLARHLAQAERARAALTSPAPPSSPPAPAP